MRKNSRMTRERCKLIGGPYHGAAYMKARDIPETLVFTAGGHTGHYFLGEWVKQWTARPLRVTIMA